MPIVWLYSLATKSQPLTPTVWNRSKMDGWPLNSQIKLPCFQFHYFYSSFHPPLIHSRTVATTRQNCSTCSRKLRSFQTSAAPLHSPSSTLAYFFLPSKPNQFVICFDCNASPVWSNASTKHYISEKIRDPLSTYSILSHVKYDYKIRSKTFALR